MNISDDGGDDEDAADDNDAAVNHGDI